MRRPRSEHRRVAREDEGPARRRAAARPGWTTSTCGGSRCASRPRRTPRRKSRPIAAALEWGKKTGKARVTGVSTHHRPWIAEAVAKYPPLEVIVTPYSAGTQGEAGGEHVRRLPQARRGHDRHQAVRQRHASSSPAARPTRRPRPKTTSGRGWSSATCWPATCSRRRFPGLMTVDQVKNAAAAVRERRQLDLAEAGRHRGDRRAHVGQSARRLPVAAAVGMDIVLPKAQLAHCT